MDPSTPPPAPSTTPRLTAQDGVDMMWRYQLRKESAALLERLDESRKMIEEASSETTKKLQDAAERISTLESKLASVDDEGQKLREAKQKWDHDIAALKDQMGIITDHVIPETQLTSEQPQLPQPTESEAPRFDKTPPSFTSPISTQATPLKIINPPTVPSDRDLPPTGALTPHTLPVVESQPPIDFSPGPRTRSRNKSMGLAPITNAPVETPRRNAPRIYQGTNSLTTYHQNACTAFASLSKDRQSEIEFVGQFIKGIGEPKTRNALVDELQRLHPCRTNKDGKLEILCEWVDVADALNKMGLLAARPSEAPLQSQGVRRKKKILIPRELIESGMMR